MADIKLIYIFLICPTNNKSISRAYSQIYNLIDVI